MSVFTVAMMMGFAIGAETLQQASQSTIANKIGANTIAKTGGPLGGSLADDALELAKSYRESATTNLQDANSHCLAQADTQESRIGSLIDKQVDTDEEWLDKGSAVLSNMALAIKTIEEGPEGAGTVSRFDSGFQCEGATCKIFEDPHVFGFDGAQLSLLALSISSKATSEAGDKWLVKNDHVEIQARYVDNAERPERSLLVGAIAVSGAFVENNVLIIGSLGDPITWNGRQLSESGQPDFSYQFDGDDFALKLKHSDHSRLVTDLSHENPGIDVELPNNIRLIVNRLHDHVNVAIKMCQLDGGQDGLCGNFNGVSADDAMEFASSRRGIDVLPQESLFNSSVTSSLLSLEHGLAKNERTRRYIPEIRSKAALDNVKKLN
jgi:hypothetical protein